LQYPVPSRGDTKFSTKFSTTTRANLVLTLELILVMSTYIYFGVGHSRVLLYYVRPTAVVVVPKVQSCTREHLSHDIHGQCLHALYVSSVHVSDQHQNKYKYLVIPTTALVLALVPGTRVPILAAALRLVGAATRQPSPIIQL
jgi:hypothetical protein